MASGVGDSANWMSASSAPRTRCTGSRFGNGQSATAMKKRFGMPYLIASSMCSIMVKTTGPLAVTSKFSSRRVVCWSLGRPAKVSIAKSMFSLISAGYLVSTRNPHAFIERDADAMGTLLERDRAVFVVVIFGEGRGCAGGRIAGTEFGQAGIHGVVPPHRKAECHGSRKS